MRYDRKKRAMPEDLSSAEAVSGWEETSSNTLHKTSPKGITCLDLHPSKPNLVRPLFSVFGVRGGTVAGWRFIQPQSAVAVKYAINL